MTAHQNPRSEYPAAHPPEEVRKAKPERTAYSIPMMIPTMSFMVA